MILSHTRRLAGLLALVSLIASANGRAGDGSPGESLRSVSLIKDGGLYILKRESEVRAKLQETKSSFDHFVDVVNQKASIEYELARAARLDQQIIELDHEIGDLWVEHEQRPGRPNSVQKEYFDGVKSRLDALRREKNEAVIEVRRIRSQAPVPRVIQDLDGEIKTRRVACLSEIQDFRQLIDSIDAEYSDLAKNKRVEDALTELNRGSSAKLKLGPSQEYKNARKQLVQLEKQVQSNPMSSQSRKNAQTPKPKRSAIREH